MEVFFYEAFEEEACALRRCLPPTIQAGFDAGTIQETGHRHPPAALISIRTQSLLPIEWAGELRGVLSRSTGYDHLHRWLAAAGAADVGGTAPAAARGACGYLPLYCNRAVAEQAMLMWMALLRRLPAQTAQFARFHRDGLTGLECAGRTLAVVGVGHIGHEVIRIGRGLDMPVLGVDLVPRHADVAYVSIEEALARADILVCAMNLTRENAGYFGEARLGRLRTGAIFINVARGEMSPTPDLLRLLEAGHLGGVGLDVHDREQELAVALRRGDGPSGPPSAVQHEIAHGSPTVVSAMALYNHPRAILTPHNAFNTHEAVQRKSEHSVQQVERFLATGAFLWPVPPAAA